VPADVVHYPPFLLLLQIVDAQLVTARADRRHRPRLGHRQDLAALLQKGRRLQASGDLPGAYAAFSEAVANAPGNRDAILQRDAARTALIKSYDRDATQAFQRQNLDLAIAKWDRLLELDPGNQKAKLERAPTTPAVMDYFVANKVDVAASTSFGFGGHNVALVFSRFDG